jgi:hypothetical protein
MSKRLIAALFALLMFSLPAAAASTCSPEVHNAAWTPQPTIITPHGAGPGQDCQRVYLCAPDAHPTTGCKVVFNGPKSVSVNSKCASGGSSGTCLKCETNPPSNQKCQWHLEKL